MQAGKAWRRSYRSPRMSNRLLICGRVPAHSFDRTEVEDYNVVTFEYQSKGERGDRAQTATSLAGSNVDLDKTCNLASRYRVRFTSCEALSAIVGNRTINDGAAINTFPCIEDQKKI